MRVQVVVNAQFEDRIRARIHPGKSFQRVGLFIHQRKMAKKAPKGDQKLPLIPVLCFRNATDKSRGRVVQGPKQGVASGRAGGTGPKSIPGVPKVPICNSPERPFAG